MEAKLDAEPMCALITCAGGGDDGAIQGTAGPRRADVHPKTHVKQGCAASEVVLCCCATSLGCSNAAACLLQHDLWLLSTVAAVGSSIARGLC